MWFTNILEFALVLGFAQNSMACDECCDKFLITDGSPDGVPDEKMTASSVLNGATGVYGPQLARLNADGTLPNARWFAGSQDTDQWIQVEFDTYHEIRGVITRGHNLATSSQWVSSYFVLHSYDGVHWSYVADESGNTLFPGNVDIDTPVINMLEKPFIAKFVRLNPQSWSTYVTMRFELIGCETIHPIV